MNIEQLQYIIKVAETRSISNASESLHISQAGISMAITSLEKELGIKIFKRSRLGTVPTEEGMEIIQKSYEVMSKLEEIRESVQLQTNTMEKELRVSSTQSLFLTVLPKSLALFKKKYPNVKIVIEEKGGQEVIHDVLNNKIDIGLLNIPKEKPKEEELEFQSLMEANVVVSVSKNSPLAGRKSITPGELINENLVVYNGPKMKAFIQDFFDQYGEMNVLFYTNNTEIIKKSVAEGLAISFSYDMGLGNDPYYLSGELVPIPFADTNIISLEFGWVRSKKQHFSRAAKEFIRCLEIHTATLK
ncbi:LysR family transcriptional regulator [Neobacillus sp. 179-C4.2 HS]|jgi:DNA-binding transcriptional LysR family regulator|uniref:LysR family transcriptional regulator n=1 Tax=Neobacillus driksii TaxID=3035913 RepID=A0ABV4YPB2_9BACI|nr:LysR family transcriptional regulator [Neobacillus sp. 179.-C4.2 HS]MDP5197153.1 LysR family transcriptional regulator [Neobacillus sp. 179.-C4.2 HS]